MWSSRKQERKVGSPSKGLPIVGNSKPTIQTSCEPKYKLSLLKTIWARTIGANCWNLLRSYGSTETHARKMSEGQLGSYAESDSRRSSQGSIW